ncbi:hypothetical protein [Pedobacter nototheniae]|uniref:hypothetical protein n=1 Tax=Pedobacter nototheniae TaxID=2488994 RepID=UPI0010401DD1|nr:hypothetical protein [Pedobacter nototheniae]
MKTFNILFVFLLGLFPIISIAQTQQSETIPDWQKKVYKILMRDKSREVLEDSVALYSFTFKLKIIKSKENKIKVDQLIVSDSLMYKLFPSYKDLYSIDYSSLLKTRKKLNIIIPILISNTSPSAKRRYETRGEPLMSIESALDIAQSSLTSMIPKNKKSNEILLLNPVVIKILNLK